MKILILLSFLNIIDMSNKTATFGSGCFWCTEAIFELVDGVEDVVSGYAAGDTDNPTYKDVSIGNTNHAEVVNIIYNPKKISYLELLEIFWRTHDPTTLNRQGADVGTQYRSIILFHDDEQKELAEKTLEKLDRSGSWKSPIVTSIEAFEVFYPAENYHQDYYELNPNNSYCSYVISPKVDKFKKVFSDLLKN
ncbi:MAG: peptide-methionine (S)-S-oxide reductase [Rhodothermaeota bacterium MED-G19]|nr:MAG: peptide-methionine (S)-S-oxide reductase [Rhodothermaeota bacterium MED-G19]